MMLNKQNITSVSKTNHSTLTRRVTTEKNTYVNAVLENLRANERVNINVISKSKESVNSQSHCFFLQMYSTAPTMSNPIMLNPNKKQSNSVIYNY